MKRIIRIAPTIRYAQDRNPSLSPATVRRVIDRLNVAFYTHTPLVPGQGVWETLENFIITGKEPQ